MIVSKVWDFYLSWTRWNFCLTDNRNRHNRNPCCPRCFGCRVYFLDDNSNNRYNMRVVPVVLVVVLLFWTTTQTTCTTKKVVPVVLVVVLYFLDDNSNNLYNQECCSCCFGCRVIFLGRQLEQLVQQRMLSPLFLL